MNKLAIYHKAKSNYSFAVTSNTIRLRLRTAHKDFDKVSVIYGVKYAWSNKHEKVMELALQDKEFDYYEIDIEEPTKRFTYYFKLESKGQIYFFTDAGLLNDCDDSSFTEYYYQYPYINERDFHFTPEWIENAVCYQIFPDRFKNGNPAINPPYCKPWGTKPTTWNLMGGDLIGITEKLNYLKELGVNVVYMTPIFKSRSNHKYDIIDYFDIDPQFGTKEDFRNLVNKAHALGMRVMLDAVFNHSGIEFPPFQDVVLNGENSRYRDWFFINKFPINLEELFIKASKAKDDNWHIIDGKSILPYECFGYFPGMPKLNTANSELKQYLINAATYWIKEFNVDGWRLDVANEVDHNFWRDFRKAVKSTNPNALIIGEIWDNGEPWLRGDQYDGVMNYGLTNILKDYFGFNRIDQETFVIRINQLITRNTETANHSMLNLLDSHDTERILTTLGNEKDKLILALSIIFTFPGIPMFYYGTEIGMTGKNDPDCRKCMNWDESKWNKKINNAVKTLIQIYKSNKALQKGNFRWLNTGNSNLLGFSRKYEDKTVSIIFNCSDKEITSSISFNKGSLLFESGKTKNKFKPFEVEIYKG